MCHQNFIRVALFLIFLKLVVPLQLNINNELRLFQKCYVHIIHGVIRELVRTHKQFFEVIIETSKFKMLFCLLGSIL